MNDGIGLFADATTLVKGAYGKNSTPLTARGLSVLFTMRFTSAMKLRLSGATPISRSIMAAPTSHFSKRKPHPSASRQSTPATSFTLCDVMSYPLRLFGLYAPCVWIIAENFP